MFERLWVWIPASYTGWTFFCIDLLYKLYCLFEKTKNKRKRDRWLANSLGTSHSKPLINKLIRSFHYYPRNSKYLGRRLSLYDWSSVWLDWIQEFQHIQITNILTCSAKSTPDKLEARCTVILPLWWVFSGVPLRTMQCYTYSRTQRKLHGFAVRQALRDIVVSFHGELLRSSFSVREIPIATIRRSFLRSLKFGKIRVTLNITFWSVTFVQLKLWAREPYLLLPTPWHVFF